MASNKPAVRAKNLGWAGISALTGCVALIIIILALFIGLWFDSLLGQRGPATVCLLVLSAPISLFVMLRIALYMVKRIQSDQQHTNNDIESPD